MTILATSAPKERTQRALQTNGLWAVRFAHPRPTKMRLGKPYAKCAQTTPNLYHRQLPWKTVVAKRDTTPQSMMPHKCMACRALLVWSAAQQTSHWIQVSMKRHAVLTTLGIFAMSL